MEEELELEHLTTLLRKKGNLRYIRELINKVKAELGNEYGNPDEVISNGFASAIATNENLPNTPEILDTEKAEVGNGNSVKTPLKNEYIMRMIFDLCSVTTLKSCRLVSTEWRDFSFPSWRNKAVLRLSESGSFVGKVTELRFNTFVDLYCSENDDLQLRASPFKNYHVRLGEGSDGKHVLKILSPISHHITFSSYTGDFKRILSESQKLQSLELNFCSLFDSHDPSQSSQVYSGSTLCCPKLKRLKIVYCTLSGSDVITWNAMLRSLPNLEILQIRSLETDGFQNYDFNFAGGFQVLVEEKIARESCGNAVQDLLTIPLKELVVENMSQEIVDIFEIITMYYYPLERLSLEMDASNDEDDGIISIDSVVTRLHNSKFRETLQYLKLSLEGRSPDQKYENHWKPAIRKTFENLKELSLAPALPHGLYSLSLIDAPKLEKLVLENKNGSKDPMPISVSFTKGTNFKCLHTLEFKDNLNILSPKIIDALGDIMPNLLHLTIPLDKHSFQIVCKRFTKLQSLNILHAQSDYEEIGDESLTGVPVPQGADKSILPPNITDLKSLTDLTISCQRQLIRSRSNSNVPFTDHAVLHGFLKLPRLHYLSIAFKELSGAAETKLLAHVKGSVHIQEFVHVDAGRPGYFGLEVYSDYDNENEHKKPMNSDSDRNNSDKINDDDDDCDGDNGNPGAADSAAENDDEESMNE